LDSVIHPTGDHDHRSYFLQNQKPAIRMERSTDFFRIMPQTQDDVSLKYYVVPGIAGRVNSKVVVFSHQFSALLYRGAMVILLILQFEEMVRLLHDLVRKIDGLALLAEPVAAVPLSPDKLLA
jgi:hypothetical protein